MNEQPLQNQTSETAAPQAPAPQPEPAAPQTQAPQPEAVAPQAPQPESAAPQVHAPQPVGAPPTAQGSPVPPPFTSQPQTGYTPQPAVQPIYVPTPLQQLTGGMKFAWAVIGALLGIPGVVLAWVCNVDKVPQVKNDAVKFALIGFVVWIAGGVIVGLAIGGITTAAIFGALGAYI